MPSENTKRIAKNTVMLYIRMFLTMLVSLYTSRVVLNVLGVEDFGIYNVVGGIVIMFSFLNSSMASATQRFFSFEIGRGDFQQLTKVFSLSVTIHIGIAFIIFLLAETIGLLFLNTQMNIPAARMEAARWIYQFAILSFMISVVQVPYNAIIIARERMSVYAYISIVEVLLKLFIVFALTYFSFDKLKLYAMLIFGVSLIIAILYRIYCKRKFKESDYRFVWDKSLYKTLISFAGWNMFGSLAWLVKTQGLNIILNIFSGPLLNAAYGIASQVNVAVNSFVQNFMMALNPQIVKAYAVNDVCYMTSLLFRGSKFSYYLLLIFAIPLLFETHLILELWLKTVPEYAVVFTRLIIINSLLESFTYTMGTSIQATGRIKWYQIIVGGTILLNLPLSYLLLKFHYTPSVVFIVSIIISCVTLLQRLLILKRLIRFSFWQYVNQVFVTTGLVTLASCIVPMFLEFYMEDSIKKVLFILFSGFIMTLLSIVFVGLSKAEKTFFKNVIKRKSM